MSQHYSHWKRGLKACTIQSLATEDVRPEDKELEIAPDR